MYSCTTQSPLVWAVQSSGTLPSSSPSTKNAEVDVLYITNNTTRCVVGELRTWRLGLFRRPSAMGHRRLISRLMMRLWRLAASEGGACGQGGRELMRRVYPGVYPATLSRYKIGTPPPADEDYILAYKNAIIKYIRTIREMTEKYPGSTYPAPRTSISWNSIQWESSSC